MEGLKRFLRDGDDPRRVVRLSLRSEQENQQVKGGGASKNEKMGSESPITRGIQRTVLQSQVENVVKNMKS